MAIAPHRAVLADSNSIGLFMFHVKKGMCGLPFFRGEK